MAGSQRDTRRPPLRNGGLSAPTNVKAHAPTATVTPLRNAAPAWARPQRPEETETSSHVLGARIGQSIAAIERAVDNVAAFRQNLQYYKDLAEELTQQLDDEANDKRELERELSETQRSLMAEQSRATEAERYTVELETTIRGLEDQIRALQAQTEHLVDAAMHLLTTETAPPRRNRYAA